MTTCCVDNTAHHYFIDDQLLGRCKKCGAEKQFSPEPVDIKQQRRYWEVSLESLQEYILNKEDEETWDY